MRDVMDEEFEDEVVVVEESVEATTPGPDIVYSDASLIAGDDELGVWSWGDDGCHLP